jgi:hypothetical protein
MTDLGARGAAIALLIGVNTLLLGACTVTARGSWRACQ